MSWTPAQPFTKLSARTKAATPVTIALTSAKGRRPVVRLVIRAALLGVDWIKVGEHVSIDIGTSDHAGKLRVSKQGAFKIGMAAGRSAAKSGGTCLITLEPFPGIMPAPHPAQECRTLIESDSLIVSLPGWAVPVQSAPAAAPPVKKPFGITAPSQEELNARRMGVGR
jgi:hypothetical protein